MSSRQLNDWRLQARRMIPHEASGCSGTAPVVGQNTHRGHPHNNQRPAAGEACQPCRAPRPPTLSVSARVVAPFRPMMLDPSSSFLRVLLFCKPQSKWEIVRLGYRGVTAREKAFLPHSLWCKLCQPTHASTPIHSARRSTHATQASRVLASSKNASTQSNRQRRSSMPAGAALVPLPTYLEPFGEGDGACIPDFVR